MCQGNSVSMLDEHPLEDVLIDYVLDVEDPEIKDHLGSCPSCSRYVKEIGTIKQTLQSLPDEDVPESLRNDILNTVKNKNILSGQWVTFDVATWYRNPLIMGMGIIGVVIFLYIFFVFVL